MMVVDDLAEIVRIIERQLWSYTYTFLVISNVSLHPTPNFILTFYHQADPLQGLVHCTQPYYNNWIIRVIQDLFFSGGTTLFAACHDNRFIR